MDKAAIGDLDIRIDEKTLEPVHEVGAIARSFKLLLNSLHIIAQFSDEITKNNFDHEYQLLSDKDTIGYSLQNMRNSLLKARQEEQKRKFKEEQESWMAQGVAKFSDILRSYSQNVNQLSSKFIMELVNYLDIVQGGLFILNQEDDDTFLELKAAVAFDREKMLSKNSVLVKVWLDDVLTKNSPSTLPRFPKTIDHYLRTWNRKPKEYCPDSRPYGE